MKDFSDAAFAPDTVEVMAKALDASVATLPHPVSSTRVQTIALIHETLYRSQDYARVPFRDYARSLASNILQVMTTAANNRPTCPVP